MPLMDRKLLVGWWVRPPSSTRRCTSAVRYLFFLYTRKRRTNYKDPGTGDVLGSDVLLRTGSRQRGEGASCSFGQYDVFSIVGMGVRQTMSQQPHYRPAHAEQDRRGVYREWRGCAGAAMKVTEGGSALLTLAGGVWGWGERGERPVRLLAPNCFVGGV